MTTSGATLGMTGSYNMNSLAQMVTVKCSIPFIRVAIDQLDMSSMSTPLIIADYGSSHGRNSMYAIKFIIEYLKESKKVEDKNQILIVHNDLPSNDWHVLFDLLNADKSYFAVANGQSFYESCLPSNSLCIGYCSNSIHWLSQKPCNISEHCTVTGALDNELALFRQQARQDLIQFLKHRSSELRVGGFLILTIWCTDEYNRSDIEQVFDILYKCAKSLRLLTSQELLDYTIPLYIRSPAECVDTELFEHCSLNVVQSSLIKNSIPLFDGYQEGHMTVDECAAASTQSIRSWTESIFRQALLINGRSMEDIETILRQYWTQFEEEIKQMSQEKSIIMCDYYLVLKKMPLKTSNISKNSYEK